MKLSQQLKKFDRKRCSYYKPIATQVWQRPMLGVHDELPAITLEDDNDSDRHYVVNFNKGDIKLTNMSDKVFNIFDLLGFPLLYEIYKNEEEAIKKFSGS